MVLDYQSFTVPHYKQCMGNDVQKKNFFAALSLTFGCIILFTEQNNVEIARRDREVDVYGLSKVSST